MLLPDQPRECGPRRSRAHDGDVVHDGAPLSRNGLPTLWPIVAPGYEKYLDANGRFTAFNGALEGFAESLHAVIVFIGTILPWAALLSLLLHFSFKVWRKKSVAVKPMA